MGVMQFERFFRLTAIFDVDKQEGAQQRHRNSVPRIAGSFSVALARSFKVIEPNYGKSGSTGVGARVPTVRSDAVMGQPRQ